MSDDQFLPQIKCRHNYTKHFYAQSIYISVSLLESTGGLLIANITISSLFAQIETDFNVDVNKHNVDAIERTFQ